MPIVTPERFLLGMKKTPVLLDAALCGVTQERAAAARDGEDGWNVVEVLCHLRDFEAIFFERARAMVEQDRPTLEPRDHMELAEQNEYSKQDLAAVYEELLNTRTAFLQWLQERGEADWGRVGVHPEAGEYTLLDQAVQVVTHDVDHLEQITRILGLPCGGDTIAPLAAL